MKFYIGVDTLRSNQLIHLISIIGTLNLAAALAESAPIVESNAASSVVHHQLESSPKIKRDSKAKVASLELDTQETGYLQPAYQATDSDYGYDSGKNTYGKQASDWSLYDQGKF